MKNLSRRMKRLLAILLVETIVAVNVISGYASESDGVYTISEAEVEAELQESGNEPAVTQEEVFDNSQDSYEESYEEQESSYQEQEIQQENQNVSEGEVGTSEEENADSEAQPVAEEPSLPEEENAEQTDEDTGEIIEEAKEEETADICTCGKACSTSEYDAACPVCSAAANLAEDAKEAFLKENCLKYMGQEEPETVEPEIVNKESNITIKGISVADGSIISGSPEFEIQVADEVTLSEQAPEITGYEFTGKAYVKTGDGDVEASGIKKEIIETEKQEDGAVTQIIKETRLSFYDVNGETWTELTEDTTVAFEYKKLEEKVEEKVTVNFYAVCVDEDGNAIDGFEKTELTVSDSLDLTKAPVTIDGYNYVEASVDGVTAASLDKSKSTDEEGKETIVYSYTTADGKVEVTEDVTVTLSYEMTEEEKAAIHFYAESVDEKGNAIAGYEKKPLHFSDSMDLTAEPFAIEEYEYVEAAIDGTVVLSVDKATVEDEDGKETIAYSYTTADGSVEVSEDTTVTLTYKSVKEAAEVTLTWNYVDEEGLAIEGVEGEPEFEDTMALDDAEKAPVAIEGYEYVEATIDGAVITAITKTAEDAETGAATEETEDAEPVYSYTYTTAAGESVAIEEDTEITLCYEETGIPVKVDATVVDEFGDEIGDKYTNMELPKFTDGELVLNDVENPPVARVQVRKSLFKVIKYTYVQATIDNKIITGLKREATAATADLKEKEQEFIYSYSTDNGATWTKLKEDTTVLFEYTDGRKTVYTYEDASVSVTATLQHANAIPDDAEFVVTAVTPSTSGYNYEAYMAALNANAAAISRDAVKSNDSEDGKAAFNEKNTLLYDIAFLAAPVDEEGNTIEGELVEYQPAEGSVNISISFKQKQLEEDLAAEKETDITVVHMPLSDSVKESVATTAEATGISASDVNVEVVSDSTSITGEKIDFNLSDFSLTAVVNENGKKVFTPGTTKDFKKILGSAVNYGIVANEIAHSAHMDTNFATKLLSGNAQTTAGKYTGNHNPGDFIIAEYTGTGWFTDCSDATRPFIIYTTKAAKEKFSESLITKNPYLIIDTNYSQEELKNQVAKLISGTDSSLMNETNQYDAKEIIDYVDTAHNIIDLTYSEAGTYYVNFKSGEYAAYAGSASKLQIKMNNDQNIVFNIPDDTLLLHKFEISINGENNFVGSDASDSSADIYSQKVTFNMPNATSVKAESSIVGVVLCPNAEFNIGSTSTGWLVADKVTNGGEWHGVWQDMPDSEYTPTGYKFAATKTVNGVVPSDGELFTFELEEYVNGSWQVIQTKENVGSAINFDEIHFAEDGTYYYRVSEKAGTGDYSYDTKKYIVKLDVTSSTVTIGNKVITTYTVSNVRYYNAEEIANINIADENAVETLNFNNIKTEKGSLSVIKQVVGATTDKTFYFIVLDENNERVSQNGNTVFAIQNNGTVTIENLPLGSYQIQETDQDGNAVSYNAMTFPYQVSYSSPNVTLTANAVANITITNTYTPEYITINGSKTWEDAGNQDGKRPSSIIVHLYADGEDTGKQVTVTAAEGSGNTWNWKFTGLDKYKNENGTVTEIQYTVKEEIVDPVAKTAYEASVNGTTITNTYIPEKTEISGSKIWDDANNQDGKRPSSIIVHLYADGEDTGKQVTVTAAEGSGNTWNWKFTGLDKYKNENGTVTEIQYTVKEEITDTVAKTAYESSVNGTTITNTYIPEKTEISGSKTWDDANNQDGKRPDSITINLLADGKPVDSKTVKAAADGSWNYSFTDLPKYANGNEIVYTVTEDAVKDYSTAIEGYNFKNSYTPSKTSITVTKAWVDANNQDGKRSSKIMVQLYADGNASGEPVELKESNNWTYTWSELPKMKAGQTIEYTVDEVDESGQSYTPGGYTKQITGDAEQGFIITNTHVPQTTSISGSKNWDDANNQDGKRPTSITVKLLEDGTVIKTTVVTPDTAGNWNYSFTDLPVYKNGQKITYTVEEEEVAGYVPSIDGTTITNRHIPETTSISGSKIWDDANNQDGRRPAKITVTLLANGVPTASKEVTADDNWQFSFEDLPKYANGEKITYTIQETTVSDYTTVITGDAANGFTITNSYTPGKTNVEGVKTWNDADNQDGKRPASITINLLADGVEVDSKTVTAQDGWKWNFTNLPEYKNGKKITYTITEDPIENYETEVDGYNVTNSHTPKLVDFSGVKTWNDGENQDGKRPASITIRLLANGEEVRTQKVTAANNWSWEFKGLPKYKDGKEIGYTITEDEVPDYDPNVNGFNVTNTHIPETVDISGTKTWNDNDDQDGIRPDKITINLLADGKKMKSVTVGSADGWSWSFTGLPKYADGQEIRYTITEDEVKDYSPNITKTGDYEYKVVNSYTPGKTSKTVTKIWEDNNNQDGIRPLSIQVVLLADGQKADVTDAEVTLNVSNNWTYTWSNLDLKANKKTIKYTVQEIGTIEGYNTSYSEDTFTITNTHTPAKVYVEGTKTWEDNNNQDGIRPESIIVKLYADGELKDSKEVTAADGWSWKFDQLPKFKNVDGSAVKIQYSVQEEKVTGYDPTYPAGSFDIVNRHTPEKISLDGIKIWEDNNDQDGIRPDSVTMKLFADGKDTGKTAIASKADGWKYRFANLDKYKENGAEIKYTVEEVAVEGYEPTVNGTTVTNSHTPEKTSIEGTKVWNDADNQDGRRPERITIHLYADGREVASKTLTADTNQGNTWNWSFTDLDKKKDGKDIAYTVTEDEVMGYTTTISGTTITNTYKPEVTQISGTKIWLDNNNQDGKRPDSITILLLADGKIKLSTTTNAAANWEYSFADLPVYENGHKIIYTVEEIVPEGYKESYDGNNIMNQYDPEKTSVNGIKTWNDNDNQDGIRPQSITVHLYADGVDTGKKVTTDESRNWKYSFGDLDKYKDGVEIVYTVVEDQVKDYTTSIDGYNITNTHTPETIDVSGSKTWNDAGNQDKVRPDKITIRLYADGKEIQHREVTASENWKWSFTDLPKYADGKEIAYTISEDPVDDYTTEVKGYDVINTHKPAVVEIKGIKTWNDSDDQDGKRPTEIIVRLYADGTEVDNRTVTEKSGWIYRFTNLPKYAEDQQGHEIIYTVREDVVEGYSTEYTEDSYDITNSYTPEETSRTVTKIWEDGKNQDGLRPTSIMVQLMADKKPYGDPVELNESNNWTYTWTRLPVKEKKKEITYTVKEISKIEGYDTTCSDDTFIITNTHKPAEVFVEGTKTWDDNNNQDGKRPTSITINLLADGEKIDSMVVTPAADGTWSWRFDNLPKYKNVNGTVTKIQYSIEEIKVDGYESRKDYTNDRFNLINTHKPETVDLSGSKTWNDNDNADGSRPASIKISLLADGAVVAEKTVTEADGWSWSFKDLPKYADGKEIRYAVSEDVVDGYTPSYSENGLSVINSYTPERTGRSVVKIWDDSNNADQIRPVSIQVQLFADGAAYGDVITLSDGNNWSYTWSDLPAKKNGQYISYTVQEITNVNGYTVSISESGTVFTIVNYHPVTPPPTPTPSDEPTPTPSTPGATPSAPTPTPPTGEVLGAKRCEGVLGARRGLDQAVLGKRRRPSTGDSAAMIIWVITLFGAMGGVVASIAGLKKKGDKK